MQIDGAGAAALAAIQQIGSLREPRSPAPIQTVTPAQSQSLQSPANAVVSLPGSKLSSQAVTTLQQTVGETQPLDDAGRTNGELAAPIAGLAPPLGNRPRPDEETEAPEEDPAEQQQAAEADEEGSDGLTRDEEAVVQQLQQRDAEVRRHEQAHAAAGGRFAGSPTYEYERGPDGRLYAIGGEVDIDTSAIPGDPQATIAKAQQVRRAALAPTQPSPQDRRVASEAQQQISQARADLRAEQAEARAEEAEDRREEAEATDATRGESGETTAAALGEATQRRDTVQQSAGVSIASGENGQPSPAIASGELASRSLQAGQAFNQALGLSGGRESPQPRSFF